MRLQYPIGHSRAFARLFAFLSAAAVTVLPVVTVLSGFAAAAAALPAGKVSAFAKDLPTAAASSAAKDPAFVNELSATAEAALPAGKILASAKDLPTAAALPAGKDPVLVNGSPAATAALPDGIVSDSVKEMSETVLPVAKDPAFVNESPVATAALPAGSVLSVAEKKGDELFPAYILRGRLLCDTENHPKGTMVQVLEGQSDCYYLVESRDGDRMVVAWEAIALTEPPRRVLSEVSAEDIERTARERGYTSDTDWLLWTSLYRTETYLFRRLEGAWRLERRMACSVGDKAHPTPRGRFAVTNKLTCIGKPGRYLCRHALCFRGAYMYHSVPLVPSGDAVLDGRLGMRLSKGCIRLSPEEAEALYSEIPCGTAVYLD